MGNAVNPHDVVGAAGGARLWRPTRVWIIVVLCVGLRSWVPFLEFQLDDYFIIPAVGWLLGIEPRPAEPSWANLAQRDAHRPSLWALLWAVRSASGGQSELASPWRFHTVVLLGYVGAAVLLFRLLRVRLGDGPAVMGCMVFATTAGGLQAVTWIAAAGDMLSVLGVVVACVCVEKGQRSQLTRHYVLAAAALAGAVGAKETALFLSPLIGLCWLSTPNRAPASRRDLIIVASIAVCCWYVAWLSRDRVWVGVTPDVRDTWKLTVIARDWLLPWSGATDATGNKPLIVRCVAGMCSAEVAQKAVGALCAALWVGIGVGGWKWAGARYRRWAAALWLAWGVAQVPLLALVGDSALGLDRALLPSSLIMSTLAAVCLSGRALGRRIMWVLVGAVICIQVDVLACRGRAEVAVAESIRGIRRELGKAVDGRGTAIVLGEPTTWRGVIPVVGPSQASAVRPPFMGLANAVSFWGAEAPLERNPLVCAATEAVRVLQWRGDVLAETTRGFEAAPSQLPDLVQDPEDRSLWRPVGRAPTRVIAGLMIGTRSGDGPCRGTATWLAGTLRKVSVFDAGGFPAVVSVADVDERWVREDQLMGVRLEGIVPEQRPRLVRSIPDIGFISPEHGDLINLYVAPRIVFTRQPEAGGYIVTWEFIVGDMRVPVRWKLIPAVMSCNENVCSACISGPSIADNVTWSQITERLVPTATGRLWCLPVDVEIEAVDMAGRNVIARSKRHLVGLVLRRP